jgi:hypothetical protein
VSVKNVSKGVFQAMFAAAEAQVSALIRSQPKSKPYRKQTVLAQRKMMETLRAKSSREIPSTCDIKAHEHNKGDEHQLCNKIPTTHRILDKHDINYRRRIDHFGNDPRPWRTNPYVSDHASETSEENL